MGTQDLLSYMRDEDEEKNEAVSRAIYALEIERLGLSESTILFPGNNVDLHIKIGGSETLARFRSKVFVSGGTDLDGNEVPVLSDINYFMQNWDTGGCYLSPTEISGEDYA